MNISDFKSASLLVLLTILFAKLLELHLLCPRRSFHHLSSHTWRIIRLACICRRQVTNGCTIRTTPIIPYVCRVRTIFHVKLLLCRCWFLRSRRLYTTLIQDRIATTVACSHLLLEIGLCSWVFSVKVWTVIVLVFLRHNVSLLNSKSLFLVND